MGRILDIYNEMQKQNAANTTPTEKGSYPGDAGSNGVDFAKFEDLINNPDVYLSGDSGDKSNFVNNATSDLSSLLKGLLNLPGVAIGAVTNPSSIPDTIAKAGGGILGEYNDLLGQPFRDGGIHAPDLKKTGQHLYERPVSSILDIIPFIKPLKALGGVGKTGEATSAVANTSRASTAAEAVSRAAPEAVSRAAPEVSKEALVQDLMATLKDPKSFERGVIPYPNTIERLDASIASKAAQSSPKYAARYIDDLGGKAFVPGEAGAIELAAPAADQAASAVAQAASGGEGVSKIGRFANKLAESLNPASKKMISKQNYSDSVIDIGNIENKFGVTGEATAAGKAKAYTQGKITSGAEISKKLANSNYSTDSIALGKLLKNKLLSTASFDELKEVNRIVNGVKRGGLFDLKTGNQIIDAQKLNKLKESLYEYGSQNSVARKVGEDAARVIRELLDEKVDGIRPHLNDYQVLAEGFNKLPEPNALTGGGIFDLLKKAGGAAASKGTQFAYNKAGGAGAEAAAGAAPKAGIIGKTAGLVGKGATSRYNQAFRNYPTGSGEQTQAPQSVGQGSQEQDLMALLTQAAGQGASSKGTNPYPIEKYTQDIANDPKNLAVYKEIFNAYQKEFADAKVPVGIQNQLIAAESALTIINEIENLYGQLGNSDNGLVASLQGIGKTAGAALQTDERARAYQSTKAAASRRLIKAMGEVGTLSKSDIDAAQALIPGLSDSTDTAALKLETLRSIINSNKQTIQSKYQTNETTGGGDLMSLLQSLQ